MARPPPPPPPPPATPTTMAASEADLAIDSERLSALPEFQLITHEHVRIEHHNFDFIGLGKKVVKPSKLITISADLWEVSHLIRQDDIEVLGRIWHDHRYGEGIVEIFADAPRSEGEEEQDKESGPESAEGKRPPVEEPFGLREQFEKWGYRVEVLDVRKARAEHDASLWLGSKRDMVEILDATLASPAIRQYGTYEFGFITVVERDNGSGNMAVHDCDKEIFDEIMAICESGYDCSLTVRAVSETGRRFWGLIQNRKVVLHYAIDPQVISADTSSDDPPVTATHASALPNAIAPISEEATGDKEDGNSATEQRPDEAHEGSSAKKEPKEDQYKDCLKAWNAWVARHTQTLGAAHAAINIAQSVKDQQEGEGASDKAAKLAAEELIGSWRDCEGGLPRDADTVSPAIFANPYIAGYLYGIEGLVAE